MKPLTIVGAGWAGLAAAVAATQAGWHVSLYEAASEVGGRARRLRQSFADQPLDNGQHILIGAYQSSLSLMRTVGLNPDSLLLRLPLDVRLVDGTGLCLPDWPRPLNLLAGLTRARGWTWHDKTQLMKAAWRWQRDSFECPLTWTVAQLCDTARLTPRVTQALIEPLCLSALNTSLHEASAHLFLRVLHDALLGEAGSSDLLLPRTDLGRLLPDACVQWLQAHGAQVHLHQRVQAATLDAWRSNPSDTRPVLLACPASDAARLVAHLAPEWAQCASALPHNAIATVYLQCKDAHFQGLPRPMMALRSDPLAPAQFVFDRGSLTQQARLLAAVVSACTLGRDEVAQRVCAQVREQLELSDLQVVQTVVEKRATLACTPVLQRPAPCVRPGLWACGDYIAGPYPSTLEGAVRSGQQVVGMMGDRF